MRFTGWLLRMTLLFLFSWLALGRQGNAATVQKHYFGHDAVQDQYGVIAPWYKGQNGQFDFRVRVAAETIKRYPWANRDRAVMAAPEYVFNGLWKIDSEGKITIPLEKDSANGDLAQRAAYTISSMLEYYRYSGDPAGFARITVTIDYLLAHCQTDARQGWPNMLISVPNMGIPYGDCRLGPSEDLASGNGKIQLDIVAELGLQLIRAYEMIGDVRWYNAAKHWADLLAENRRRVPGASPWGRYADKFGGTGMNRIQTGGVATILWFLDEMIRSGYVGRDNSLVAARDDGRRYLRDVLLPAWTVDDTWGRHFWDWEDPVQTLYPTDFAPMYLMDHPEYFANWRNDVRNILSLNLLHTSASPRSNGDTYSGAWAYPESSGCCERSLSYSPQELARAFARYGVEADSEWGREIARRSELLATYDGLENGQAIDGIDGVTYVDGSWFKIAHPMALDYVLKTMGWLPEVMGPNRENHIMRSSGVVKRVIYGAGEIRYSTFDAPANSGEVLRLAFSPKTITADGKVLEQRAILSGSGYTIQPLKGGDAIVHIRHDGATEIIILGTDPQVMVDNSEMAFQGNWHGVGREPHRKGAAEMSAQPGASVSYQFQGNQVRLVGEVGISGGLADVYVDGVKELVGIDCFSPIPLRRQILYYQNGLADSPHTLKVVVRGESNPISMGKEVYVEGVEYSQATGDAGYGEGGGPKGAQRLIFGYTGRNDYVDSQGGTWRPGAEYVVRTGNLTDAVAKTWWTMRQAVFVKNTPDQELYRYGVHWPDFTVNLTVAPGNYHVRLKFAETEFDGPGQRGINIYLNGTRVVGGLDVWATAGGANKAVDLIYNDVLPQNGVIAIRLEGTALRGGKGEAMVQAIEVAPGDGGRGSVPKTID
ncbi:MAG: malectin domain-containing carbohydrate-binding protein [Terriglobia bacterium]